MVEQNEAACKLQQRAKRWLGRVRRRRFGGAMGEDADPGRLEPLSRQRSPDAENVAPGDEVASLPASPVAAAARSPGRVPIRSPIRSPTKSPAPADADLAPAPLPVAAVPSPSSSPPSSSVDRDDGGRTLEGPAHAHVEPFRHQRSWTTDADRSRAHLSLLGGDGPQQAALCAAGFEPLRTLSQGAMQGGTGGALQPLSRETQRGGGGPPWLRRERERERPWVGVDPGIEGSGWVEPGPTEKVSGRGVGRWRWRWRGRCADPNPLSQRGTSGAIPLRKRSRPGGSSEAAARAAELTQGVEHVEGEGGHSSPSHRVKLTAQPNVSPTGDERSLGSAR